MTMELTWRCRKDLKVSINRFYPDIDFELASITLAACAHLTENACYVHHWQWDRKHPTANAAAYLDEVRQGFAPPGPCPRYAAGRTSQPGPLRVLDPIQPRGAIDQGN